MCFGSVSISLIYICIYGKSVSTNALPFRQFDCQIGNTPRGQSVRQPPLTAAWWMRKPKAKLKLPRRRRTQLMRLDGYAWGIYKRQEGGGSGRGGDVGSLSVICQCGNNNSNNIISSSGSIKEATPSPCPLPLFASSATPPPLFVAVFVVCAWRWIYKLQLIKSWWVCVSEIKRRLLPTPSPTDPADKQMRK